MVCGNLRYHGGMNQSNKLTIVINSMLSQFRLSVAGVGLGTAYSLRFKAGFAPMIAGGAAGTSADLVYGYLVECAKFRQSSDE